MCRGHWMKVPADIRGLVNLFYKAGQDIGAALPTNEWLCFASQAVAEVLIREGRHDEATEWVMRSERCRDLAAGMDPDDVARGDRREAVEGGLIARSVSRR